MKKISSFLSNHILNTAVILFLAFLALFILKMDLMITVWYVVIAGLLWICRGGITNIVAGIIEHKSGSELNKVSLQNLRLAVCTALLILLILVPTVLVLIFGGIGYVFEFCSNVISVLAEDLTMVNGIGWMIFSLAEILVTIIASVAIIFLLSNLSGKNMVIGIIATVVVQRAISFFYYYTDGSYVSGILDFILGTILFVGITALFWLLTSLIKRAHP